MVFGFLAAFALAGLATAAWPVYLHLRRERERKIQLVPSLKLFQWRNVPARRRRVEQLFLLLSRVGIVAALFFLVSQPYLESARNLPLPQVNRSQYRDLFLGILVDDCLSAFQGEEEAERLHRAKAWLLEQLDRLPEDTCISVATTSHPRPTGFMTREDARSLIGGIQVIPREGNGAETLYRLAELFGDRRGALVAAIPLDAWLWQFQEAGAPPGAIQKLFIRDTTKWRKDSYVHLVRRQEHTAEGDFWICQLAGDQRFLEGKELQIQDRMGNLVSRRRISPHEALRKQVIIDGSTLEKAFQVTLVDGGNSSHPWLRYYVEVGSRNPRPSRVAFFREDGTDAALATKILLALVKAVRPEIPRTLLSFQEASTGELPPASAAIFVGSRGATPQVAAWFERQIEAGIQVLCLPLEDDAGDPEGEGDTWLRLPSWGAATPLWKKELTPLRINTSRLPSTHRFDDLLLADLQDMDRGILREPVFTSGGQPVIATASGKTLLSLVEPKKGSAIWALSVPLTMDEGSLIYHPIFPVLLNWILFPSPRGKEKNTGSVLVGESVKINSWLGGPFSSGEVRTPSGRKISISSGPGESNWLRISEAGIYEMNSPEDSRFRVANHLRPAGSQALDRSSWKELSQVHEAVWLEETEFISPEDLKGLPLQSGEPSKRYDLTPVMALFLAGFLGFELILLFKYWRRGRH